MKRNRFTGLRGNDWVLPSVLVTGIVFTVLSLAAGCVTKVTPIRPFEGSDFLVLTNGQQYVAPKDGYFLSDEYLEQAVEAKLDRKK